MNREREATISILKPLTEIIPGLKHGIPTSTGFLVSHRAVGDGRAKIKLKEITHRKPVLC